MLRWFVLAEQNTKRGSEIKLSPAVLRKSSFGLKGDDDDDYYLLATTTATANTTTTTSTVTTATTTTTTTRTTMAGTLSAGAAAAQRRSRRTVASLCSNFQRALQPIAATPSLRALSPTPRNQHPKTQNPQNPKPQPPKPTTQAQAHPSHRKGKTQYTRTKLYSKPFENRYQSSFKGKLQALSPKSIPSHTKLRRSFASSGRVSSSASGRELPIISAHVRSKPPGHGWQRLRWQQRFLGLLEGSRYM